MDSGVTNNGIRTIVASEGYLLTLKNINQDEERIYTDMLYLGINDNADNWIEVKIEDVEDKQES